MASVLPYSNKQFVSTNDNERTLTESLKRLRRNVKELLEFLSGGGFKAGYSGLSKIVTRHLWAIMYSPDGCDDLAPIAALMAYRLLQDGEKPPLTPDAPILTLQAI